MRYAVGQKIFEEYKEAVEFCMALMRRGVVSCIRETRANATHRHLGNGKTEPIKQNKKAQQIRKAAG